MKDNLHCRIYFARRSTTLPPRSCFLGYGLSHTTLKIAGSFSSLLKCHLDKQFSLKCHPAWLMIAGVWLLALCELIVEVYQLYIISLSPG
ncbi:hypothetical protein BDV35DRAFT_371909 [Aspergillus flavus]|uniref:Uncharacterized protein n=1 Tax=Aspergillus flavus TaxID=5059 RepID=A0A5N6GI55_ASPFL|nr:hypothetical protein BDV35DRAFT_371909 [Aspergillus flavus]